MAYDEGLAERLRELLGDERGVTEKRMFGGLAFLVHGNMAVSVSGRGGLMVRVDPTTSDDLLTDGVELVEMRGRLMPGWLRVRDTRIETDEQLREWLGRGIAFARSLPPKR